MPPAIMPPASSRAPPGPPANFDKLSAITDRPIPSSRGSSNPSVTAEAWVYPTGSGVVISEIGQGAVNTNWHDSQIEVLSVAKSMSASGQAERINLPYSEPFP